MRLKSFLSVMMCCGVLFLSLSCKKTPAPSSKDRIGFAVEGVESKGYVATVDYLRTEYKSFVTDAYVCDPAEGENPHLMNSARVNYVNGAWKTAETFYWPSNSSVAFLSYAPVLDATSLGKMTNLSYDSTSKAFSFDYVSMPQFTDDISLSYQGVDVTTMLRSQDLLLACSEQSVSEGDVKVHFKHALAAVGFDISALFEDTSNSKVSSVVFGMGYIWSKGKCTVDKNGFSWTLDKSSENYRGSSLMLATRAEGSEYYYKGAYKNQCTFIIPQTIASEGAGYNVMGFYAYFSDGRFPVMFNVNIPAGTKYEAGKFYGYRLKKSGLDWYLELAINGIVLGERNPGEYFEANFDSFQSLPSEL